MTEPVRFFTILSSLRVKNHLCHQHYIIYSSLLTRHSRSQLAAPSLSNSLGQFQEGARKQEPGFFISDFLNLYSLANPNPTSLTTHHDCQCCGLRVESNRSSPDHGVTYGLVVQAAGLAGPRCEACGNQSDVVVTCRFS